MMKVEVVYLFKGPDKPELGKEIKLEEHTTVYEIQIYEAKDVGPRLRDEINLILKTYYGIKSIKFYL